MDIKRYIAESEKTYPVRIKTVVQLNDDLVSKIENVIAKFQPLEVTKATKTILQRHPLDFKNVENAEVWIIDVVFGLPASPVDVREEIRKALNCCETFVVVRSNNEQIEIETLMANAVADIEEEAKKRGLVPASLLSTDSEYYEAEYDEDFAKLLAGNEYNNMFLAYLADVQKERDEIRHNSEPGSVLFNWIKMPDRKDQEPYQSDVDFNKDIEGAPRVSPKTSIKKQFKNLISGAIDNQDRTIKRIYADKNGKRVVISRQLKGE